MITTRQIEDELMRDFPRGCRVRQQIRKSRNGAGQDWTERYGTVEGYRRGLLVIRWDGLRDTDMHSARHVERGQTLGG